jgi:hypothetical protein
MVRDITKGLAMADSTIQLLSKADLQRMKDITNRFNRPEIRVMAKIMVLRAILSTKQQPTPAKAATKPS